MKTKARKARQAAKQKPAPKQPEQSEVAGKRGGTAKPRSKKKQPSIFDSPLATMIVIAFFLWFAYVAGLR